MRRIIATTGATLVAMAAVAASATPASACQGPGWYNCDPPKPISPGAAATTPSGGEVLSLD
jgi:hypothetical protein